MSKAAVGTVLELSGLHLAATVLGASRLAFPSGFDPSVNAPPGLSDYQTIGVRIRFVNRGPAVTHYHLNQDFSLLDASGAAVGESAIGTLDGCQGTPTVKVAASGTSSVCFAIDVPPSAQATAVRYLSVSGLDEAIWTLPSSV